MKKLNSTMPGRGQTFDIMSLTDQEVTIILAVLQKDDLERKILDAKICELRKEIQDIRKASALTAGDDQKSICARCKVKFSPVVLPWTDHGIRCSTCKFKVCARCSTKQTNGSVLCCLCLKYRQEKLLTGEWMNKGQSSSLHGSELMKSLLKNGRRVPPAYDEPKTATYTQRPAITKDVDSESRTSKNSQSSIEQTELLKEESNQQRTSPKSSINRHNFKYLSKSTRGDIVCSLDYKSPNLRITDVGSNNFERLTPANSHYIDWEFRTFSTTNFECDRDVILSNVISSSSTVRSHSDRKAYPDSGYQDINKHFTDQPTSSVHPHNNLTLSPQHASSPSSSDCRENNLNRRNSISEQALNCGVSMLSKRNKPWMLNPFPQPFSLASSKLGLVPEGTTLKSDSIGTSQLEIFRKQGQRFSLRRQKTMEDDQHKNTPEINKICDNSPNYSERRLSGNIDNPCSPEWNETQRRRSVVEDLIKRNYCQKSASVPALNYIPCDDAVLFIAKPRLTKSAFFEFSRNSIKDKLHSFEITYPMKSESAKLVTKQHKSTQTQEFVTLRKLPFNVDNSMQTLHTSQILTSASSSFQGVLSKDLLKKESYCQPSSRPNHLSLSRSTHQISLNPKHLNSVDSRLGLSLTSTSNRLISSDTRSQTSPSSTPSRLISSDTRSQTSPSSTPSLLISSDTRSQTSPSSTPSRLISSDTRSQTSPSSTPSRLISSDTRSQTSPSSTPSRLISSDTRSQTSPSSTPSRLISSDTRSQTSPSSTPSLLISSDTRSQTSPSSTPSRLISSDTRSQTSPSSTPSRLISSDTRSQTSPSFTPSRLISSDTRSQTSPSSTPSRLISSDTRSQTSPMSIPKRLNSVESRFQISPISTPGIFGSPFHKSKTPTTVQHKRSTSSSELTKIKRHNRPKIARSRSDVTSSSRRRHSLKFSDILRRRSFQISGLRDDKNCSSTENSSDEQSRNDGEAGARESIVGAKRVSLSSSQENPDDLQKGNQGYQKLHSRHGALRAKNDRGETESFDKDSDSASEVASVSSCMTDSQPFSGDTNSCSNLTKPKAKRRLPKPNSILRVTRRTSELPAVLPTRFQFRRSSSFSQIEQEKTNSLEVVSNQNNEVEPTEIKTNKNISKLFPKRSNSNASVSKLPVKVNDTSSEKKHKHFKFLPNIKDTLKTLRRGKGGKVQSLSSGEEDNSSTTHSLKSGSFESIHNSYGNQFSQNKTGSQTVSATELTRDNSSKRKRLLPKTPGPKIPVPKTPEPKTPEPKTPEPKTSENGKQGFLHQSLSIYNEVGESSKHELLSNARGQEKVKYNWRERVPGSRVVEEKLLLPSEIKNTQNPFETRRGVAASNSSSREAAELRRHRAPLRKCFSLSQEDIKPKVLRKAHSIFTDEFTSEFSANEAGLPDSKIWTQVTHFNCPKIVINSELTSDSSEKFNESNINYSPDKKNENSEEIYGKQQKNFNLMCSGSDMSDTVSIVTEVPDLGIDSERFHFDLDQGSNDTLYDTRFEDSLSDDNDLKNDLEHSGKSLDESEGDPYSIADIDCGDSGSETWYTHQDLALHSGSQNDVGEVVDTLGCVEDSLGITLATSGSDRDSISDRNSLKGKSFNDSSERKIDRKTSNDSLERNSLEEHSSNDNSGSTLATSRTDTNSSSDMYFLERKTSPNIKTSNLEPGNNDHAITLNDNSGDINKHEEVNPSLSLAQKYSSPDGGFLKQHPTSSSRRLSYQESEIGLNCSASSGQTRELSNQMKSTEKNIRESSDDLLEATKYDESGTIPKYEEVVEDEVGRKLPHNVDDPCPISSLIALSGSDQPREKPTLLSLAKKRAFTSVEYPSNESNIIHHPLAGMDNNVDDYKINHGLDRTSGKSGTESIKDTDSGITSGFTTRTNTPEYRSNQTFRSQTDQTFRSQTDQTSIPTIAVTNIGSESFKEEDDDLDELFTNRLPNQLLGSRSSLADSRESIYSVYSDAGEVNYGRIPVTGEILFSIDYNHKGSTLEVHVKQCRDLAPVDVKHSRSDPYVKTYLLPDKSRSSKRKTRIKKHTLNPVFDEVVKYQINISELESRSLWLTVWHNDRFGRNDFLGEVTIPLDCYRFDQNALIWYTLQERTVTQEPELFYKGDLFIALKYIPADMVEIVPKKKSSSFRRKGKEKEAPEKMLGEVHVLVREAKNLTAMRASSGSNPFCKGYILPDVSHSTKQKTQIIKKTTNPVWQHILVFEGIDQSLLYEYGLELTVWDHEKLSSNDFLGGVRLNLGQGFYQGKPVDWMDARGEEIESWQTMIDHPNEWVDAELPLRASMGKQNVKN